jgi:hypothetical protein
VTIANASPIVRYTKFAIPYHVCAKMSTFTSPPLTCYCRLDTISLLLSGLSVSHCSHRYNKPAPRTPKYGPCALLYQAALASTTSSQQPQFLFPISNPATSSHIQETPLYNKYHGLTNRASSTRSHLDSSSKRWRLSSHVRHLQLRHPSIADLPHTHNWVRQPQMPPPPLPSALRWAAKTFKQPSHLVMSVL